jgi:ribosome modulation factor
MWPHPETIATAIVKAAEICNEDPIQIAQGAHGCTARMYAFLALAIQFKDANRAKLGMMVGGTKPYVGTVRFITHVALRKERFDIDRVNAVRAALGYEGLVSQRDCWQATFEPHPKRGPKIKPLAERASEAKRATAYAPPPPDLPPSPRQDPAKATPKTILQSLAVTKPRVSQEVMTLTEINHIPSRQEQLDSEKAMGGRMLIVPMPGEPDPSRSALAERRASPAPEVERKDSLTLFTEGYNHGLHGDDAECPAYLSWQGKEYLDGWITGFNDRYLLTAPREQFDAAIEGEV